MPKDDLPLRVETTEADEQLIAEMGTDPEAWAQGLHKVMPMGVAIKTATAWFHHAIEAGRKAARQMPIQQPMDTAPRNGGWVLGLVLPDGPTDTEWQPWISVTWGDKGWVDDNDNRCDPVAWVPLPDPQPRPTGWEPAVGTIMVEEINGKGWTVNGKPADVPYRWFVCVHKPDGSIDEYREWWPYADRESADRRAAKWSDELGLPIIVTLLPTPPSNVIPLRKGDTLQ